MSMFGFDNFLSQFIPQSISAAFFVKRSLIDRLNVELKRMSKDENRCFCRQTIIDKSG